MAQIKNRIVEHGNEAPDQLLANPRNWRIHPQSQQEALRDALDEIGYIQSVIVNRTTGNLIDGHLRVMLALRNDEQTIPVCYVELTEQEEALALATIDPLSAMAAQDNEKLLELMGDIETDSQALQEMLSDLIGDGALAMPGTEGQTDEDDAPEPQDDAISQRGEIYRLGNHRLMCGDSTSADDVAALMDGKKGALCLTDPPYGIKMDKGFGGSGGFPGNGKPIKRRVYSDEWDSERPDQKTFDAIQNNSDLCIIWGGNFFADILPVSTHWIVWDKLQTMPTFGDCELAWTNSKRHSVKKYTVQYNGLIGKEKQRFHPTQKPTVLFCDILNDYTKVCELISDFFLGSGTTLIACEKTGRICYGMEIAPNYCDVIRKRWAEFVHGKDCDWQGLTPTIDSIEG